MARLNNGLAFIFFTWSWDVDFEIEVIFMNFEHICDDLCVLK